MVATLKRERFTTRKVLLVGEIQHETATRILATVPLDRERPLEFLIREQKKQRSPDQNAAMWAGPLNDIAKQAWIDVIDADGVVTGRRLYRAEMWHELFKREYLPEDDDPEIELLVMDGYQKWDYDPVGNRVLIGSTRKLTPMGMGRYMTELEAFGASKGVRFHEAMR